MNTSKKSVRAKVAVAIAAGAMVLASIACNDNPCANGSACGITSPITSVEQTVIDAVNSTCPTRADGTCEVFGH